MEEKELSRETIETLITEFMNRQGTCVIATCSDNMPRASTVEFFPLGTTIYILTEGGWKVENIKKNPHVSIAVSAPFAGWEHMKGLQVTGIAEIGGKSSQIFQEGTEAYRIRRGQENAHLPDFMKVIKIIPKKMDYIDSSLPAKGFRMKQVIVY